MNPQNKRDFGNEVPGLVRAVLTQATRLRDCGDIPQSLYEAQLERITKEELRPRGLELVMRELPNGTTRFLVKAGKTGAVCEMIDCTGHRAA